MAISGDTRVPIYFDAYYNAGDYQTYEGNKPVTKPRLSGANRYANDLNYSQTQDKDAFRQWYDQTVQRDYSKFNISRLRNDKYTLNDDFEKVWSQVNAQGNKAAKGMSDYDADRADKQAFLDSLGDDDDGGASQRASQAAYLQSLLESIDQSYNIQRDALDTNKTTSTANIQKNADSFKQGLASNQALYQQGSQAIQAEITRRMAESAARNTETGNQVAAAVGGIGGSASAASAQAAANAASLASSQGYQQDLAYRMDQVMAANQRSAENSGELVRQGASGNLETNYNAMLNALLMNREQNMMQARTGAMSASSGGGGSSKKMTNAEKMKEINGALDLNDWVEGSVWNKYFGDRATTQGQAMGAQFMAMLQGDNPEDAATFFPELAREYENIRSQG